jgi:hypothetical protein
MFLITTSIDTRMSVLTPAHDDIFDLLGDSTGPKHESREEPGIDLSLDLLNIDFTNSDLMAGPQASAAKPAPVIKSDDPLTNDILSLYNLPAKKEPVVQPKSEEGKNFISNHFLFRRQILHQFGWSTCVKGTRCSHRRPFW